MIKSFFFLYLFFIVTFDSIAQDFSITGTAGINAFQKEYTRKFYQNALDLSAVLKKGIPEFSYGIYIDYQRGSDHGSQYKLGYTIAKEVFLTNVSYGGELEMQLFNPISIFGRAGFLTHKEIVYNDGESGLNWDPEKGYKFELGARAYLPLKEKLKIFIEGSYSTLLFKNKEFVEGMFDAFEGSIGISISL